jgi:hypothetical protein
MRISIPKPITTLHPLAITIAVFFLATQALANDHKVYHDGTVERGDSATGPWTPVASGTSIPFNKYLKIAAGTKAQLCRKGTPGCKNYKGTPVLPNNCVIWLRKASTAGQAESFIDIADVPGNNATVLLEQYGVCSGGLHCGVAAPNASAEVTTDTASPLATTFFQTNYVSGGSVEFCNYSASASSLSASPLVGPNVGQSFPVSPGQKITFSAGGIHAMSACALTQPANSVACCLAPDTGDDCVDIAQSACEDFSGKGIGGYNCAQLHDLPLSVGPCDVPTISEWGVAALVLLMLTAATIVMKRRLAAA